MKKLSLYILFFLLSFVGFAQTISNNAAKEKQILQLVLKTLNEKHIKPIKLDDAFSKKMFKMYLDSIDAAKIFLLESDIEEFRKYENKLDDQIKANDFSFFELSLGRIKQRSIEGKDIYIDILKNQLDFTSNEDNPYLLRTYEYYLDRKLSYAKNKAELVMKWKVLLKSCVIENVRKDFFFDNNNTQNLDNLLIENQESFLQYLEGTIFNFDNNTRDFYFRFYINAIVKQYDNNSKYYDPEIRNKLNADKTGQFEGCGIGVHSINNFIEVRSLMEGGPGWKLKKIAVGDVILKVQQENELPVNTIGFSHFEVSKLLRGKAGTTVKLTLKKSNGSIEEVSVKREVVAKNDYFLKSCIVVKNKIKYGVLSFPRFYNDIENEKANNVSDDFAKKLESLKKEKVMGLVLDLRDNKGGSIEAAVKIIGNFVAKSPVIQVLQSNKTTTLETLNDIKNWDKSIVLITNSETEAAAEVIVAAFKIHNIGLIVGEKTFGKATEQDFYDLNKLKVNQNDKQDLGAMNVTTFKSYTLDGKSFQNSGITPDITFFEKKNIDKQDTNPDTIVNDALKSIPFKPIIAKGYYFNTIKKNTERIIKSENFRSLTKQKAQEFSYFARRDQLKTLNFEKFKVDAKQIIDMKEKLVLQKSFSFDNEYYLPSEDIAMLKNKFYLKQQREQWLIDVKSDYQIDESINILEDMIKVK